MEICDYFSINRNCRVMFTIFPGQLWKFNDDMKLMNKNSNWLYQENSWTITAEGSEGNIEDQSSGKVLGLFNNNTELGTMVVLEPKKRSVSSEGQKWLRDLADESGWFRLRNPLSGRVLTAQTPTITALAGIKFKS